MPAACCLLPAACCLLPAAYCLLPAACCLLPAACCLLPASCCLLPAACCLLLAACCLLPAACCLLAAGCCLPPAACRLLPAACCLLVAACSLLPLCAIRYFARDVCLALLLRPLVYSMAQEVQCTHNLLGQPRRPSVGVSGLLWGRGLPLPYPSPLGGPIQQVAKCTNKFVSNDKNSCFIRTQKGCP